MNRDRLNAMGANEEYKAATTKKKKNKYKRLTSFNHLSHIDYKTRAEIGRQKRQLSQAKCNVY